MDNLVRQEEFSNRQRQLRIEDLVDRLVRSRRVLPEFRETLIAEIKLQMERETRRFGSDLGFELRVLTMGTQLASRVLQDKIA